MSSNISNPKITAALSVCLQTPHILGPTLAAMQVVAHSVGTWNAYEFLMLARSQGLPMPKQLFLSAMASPDLPVEKRPWRQNSSLDEKQFKVHLSSHAEAASRHARWKAPDLH